jgi:outer membrane protein OmpA-like peptidoglycan-associated protein
MKAIFLMPLALVVATLQAVNAQSTRREQQGNFVLVIGAYKVPENAARHARQAKKQKFQSSIELVNDKSLYYVSIMQTNDHDVAITEAKKMQASGPFRDAWVFSRIPYTPPAVEQPVAEQPKEEPKVEVVKEPEVIVPVKLSKADSTRLAEEKIKAKVDGQKMVMKKGDMETLNYIFFYRDAAVLRPESRFEVDRLVKLMQDHPSEKIRIHGHTNGNDPGKIIKRAPSSTDFFSLDRTVEDYGSAKELSELRANQILEYLASKGIDRKRMSTKAWGGKKPLYNVDDAKAEANVRVEIEVVKDQD